VVVGQFFLIAGRGGDFGGGFKLTADEIEVVAGLTRGVY
jgi:hypothetical protein